MPLALQHGCVGSRVEDLRIEEVKMEVAKGLDERAVDLDEDGMAWRMLIEKLDELGSVGLQGKLKRVCGGCKWGLWRLGGKGREGKGRGGGGERLGRGYGKCMGHEHGVVCMFLYWTGPQGLNWFGLGD